MGAVFQSPRRASSSGTIWARVVSPTTITRALSGCSQSRWNATRSSRVSDAIDASVPLPVNGIAYGWPWPYSNGGITRSAAVCGRAFSCLMPAIQVARTRSSSPASKVGRRSTSASRSSDSGSLSLSADRPTEALSRPAPVVNSAPSASLRAANCSAL